MTLEDGIGGTRLYDVKQPVRFCAPASVNGADATAPASPGHLVCYRVKLSTTKPAQKKPPSQLVSTRSSFGEQVLQVRTVEELCVPSLRLGEEAGEVRHSITHHRIRMDLFRADAARVKGPLAWVSRRRAEGLLVSSLFRKALAAC